MQKFDTPAPVSAVLDIPAGRIQFIAADRTDTTRRDPARRPLQEPRREGRRADHGRPTPTAFCASRRARRRTGSSATPAPSR